MMRARSRAFQALSKVPATSRRWEYYWRGGVDAPALSDTHS
jgi:hypothetical protein